MDYVIGSDHHKLYEKLLQNLNKLWIFLKNYFNLYMIYIMLIIQLHVYFIQCSCKV